MDYLSPFSPTWKTQLKDSLDVTFDLYNSLYKPYRKPNNKLIYINKQSNHPPNVLKQLPKSIAKRISDTSSSKDNLINQFWLTIMHCTRVVLKRSWSIYLVTRGENSQRTRRRKIIWLNPPYSRSVKTNIGKNFLYFLVKYFPANNEMHKTFNKNTVKVSYGCMKNMD